MKLLSNDRWTHVTEKKNIGSRFPRLKSCKGGFGDVTFVVKGEPKDKDLRTKVKTHEKHHADDDEAVFNDLLGTWDKELTKTYKQNLKAKGPSLNICEKGLYLVGGKDRNPDDLVSNIANGIVTKATDFHKSDAGAKPTTRIEEADSDCTVVKARTG